MLAPNLQISSQSPNFVVCLLSTSLAGLLSFVKFAILSAHKNMSKVIILVQFLDKLVKHINTSHLGVHIEMERKCFPLAQYFYIIFWEKAGLQFLINLWMLFHGFPLWFLALYGFYLYIGTSYSHLNSPWTMSFTIRSRRGNIFLILIV